jgi:hypothetical protein
LVDRASVRIRPAEREGLEAWPHRTDAVLGPYGLAALPHSHPWSQATTHLPAGPTRGAPPPPRSTQHRVRGR